MRLLPRTPRGTWLLAGVVWASGTAAVWRYTPATPRGVAVADGRREFLGFGPDCSTALVLRSNDAGTETALAVVDPTSGQVVATLREKAVTAEVLGRSAGGQTWLLKAGPGILKVDMTAATAEPLADESFGGAGAFWATQLAADGRRAALFDDRSRSLVLWDVTANQRLGTVPKLEPPFAFAADGKSLAAAASPNFGGCVTVLDAETLRPRITLDGPQHTAVRWTMLSDDGNYLAAYLSGSMMFGSESELACWNVATGAALFRVPLKSAGGLNDSAEWQGRFIPSATGVDLLFLETTRFERRLWRFDMAGGRPWSDEFLNQTQRWDLSPDGRTLLASAQTAKDDLLGGLARVFGFQRGSGTEMVGRLYDVASGRHIGTVRPSRSPLSATEGDTWMWTKWSPDGRTLAVQDLDDRTVWHLWDIPPRTPVAWVAGGSAILALVLAGLARRRARRLGPVIACG